MNNCLLKTAKAVRKLALLSLLTLPFLSQPASAQMEFVGTVTASAAGSELANIVGTNLLNKAREVATTAIKQGEESGNALLIKLGNELNIMTQNADILITSNMNDKIGKMSRESQVIMQAVRDLAMEIEGFKGAAFEFKDAFAVDINSRLNAISSKLGNKFYVQRATGLSQIDGRSNYQISILGTGLGLATDKQSSVLTLSINGKNIPDAIQDKNGDVTIFNIPADVLKPHFKKMDIATVSANIKALVTTKERKLLIFSSENTKEYNIALTLTLLPKFAGTFSSTVSEPKMDWIKTQRVKISKTTGNHHCASSCGGDPTRTTYQLNLGVKNLSSCNSPKQGDQKYANPSFYCHTDIRTINFRGRSITGDASACRGWNKVNFVQSRPSQGCATDVVASWDVWSHPTTWSLEADLMEYTRVQGSNTVKNIHIDLEYGQIYKVVLPKYVVDTDATIATVTTINKQQYGLSIGAADKSGFLSLVETKTDDLNQTVTFVYQVEWPKGIPL